MNGYLNNLTLRTLNTGHRVEPRLPSLFEPRAFQSVPEIDEEIETHEKVGSTVSSVAPTVGGSKALISEQKVSDGLTSARDTVASDIDSPRVKSTRDLESPSTRVDPARHRSQERESIDPVESLPVRASFALPEITDAPAAHSPSILEEESIVEGSDASTEFSDSAPLWPRSSVIDNKAESSRRAPRRRPESSSLVIPESAPEVAQSPTTIALGKTELRTQTQARETGSAAKTAKEPRIVEDSAIESDSQWTDIQTPSYTRPDPTQHPWRDAREQTRFSRRRQSFASIEPEPTINVTIGRVEVRAVPANNNKSASRRPSESPVMPLEDYLRKQRRGGER